MAYSPVLNDLLFILLPATLLVVLCVQACFVIRLVRRNRRRRRELERQARELDCRLRELMK